VSEALDDILAALASLVEEHRSEPETPDEGRDNFRCENCVACSDCRFCEGCTRCVECTYCEACQDCEACTQCRACDGCARTTHADHSADCVDCSYVTLCLDCEQCVHCFGCVGLSGEEFCLLNEKLSKSVYFKRVAALRAELSARAAAGFRPPWWEGDDEDDEIEDEPEPEPEPDPSAVIHGRELGPIRTPPLPPPPRFPTPPPFSVPPQPFPLDTPDARRGREDTSPRWVVPSSEDDSRPIEADRLLWSDAIPQGEIVSDGPTQPIAIQRGPTVTRVNRPRRPGSDDEPSAGAATVRAARRPPRRGQ
jgi:hypothetical protein